MREQGDCDAWWDVHICAPVRHEVRSLPLHPSGHREEAEQTSATGKRERLMSLSWMLKQTTVGVGRVG